MTHHEAFVEFFGREPAFPIPDDINDDDYMAFGYGDVMAYRPANLALTSTTVDARIRYRIGARLAFGYRARSGSTTADYRDDDIDEGCSGFYRVWYRRTQPPAGPYWSIREMAAAQKLAEYPSDGYIVWAQEVIGQGAGVSMVPSLNPDELWKGDDRYLVFGYDTYYPEGGAHDLIGHTATLDAAKDLISQSNRDHHDVYDTVTGKVVVDQ